MNKGLILTTASLLVSIGINSQTAQWAVRPSSAQIENYGNLLKIRKGGKCGLSDMNGNEIVSASYDSISPFRNGYALAMSFSGKRMKIDAVISDGDYEVQPVTEDVYATRYMWFSEGKMPVRSNDGWGYLGTDGNMVIPCQFQVAYPFSEGLASVLLDDQAYYIDRHMDYLPVEVGYGNIVYGSTFSGGQAIVYSGESYTPKGYIINKRGRIVSNYKVKIESTERNENSDHSVGERSTSFDSNMQEMSINSIYSVYQDGGLYGYKRNGRVIVPAQFESAEPFHGDYAKVRYLGQNGIIQIVDGDVTADIETPNIEITNKKGRGYLRLNLPSSLEDAAVRVRISDEQGKEMTVFANNSQGTSRTYTFFPTVIPQNSVTRRHKIEVLSDNLLLLKKSCDLAFTIREIKETKTATTTTVKVPTNTNTSSSQKMHIASLSLSTPKATAKRANPKNNFFVTVSVINSSDVRGSASVSLYVDGKVVGTKGVSVRGNGSANAIFAVSGIKKEHYAKVKAALKEGKTSQEAIIRFLPFD